MTVRDRLGVIEARARAATEGPWDVGPPGVVFSTGTDAMVQTVATGIGPGQVQDAEFIAAARSDVPVLVRALQAVLDVHRPKYHYPNLCEGCDPGIMDPPEWPCSTVRAIEAALQEGS